MNKYLFLLLLTSKGLFAQEPVKSVISDDYLSLIKRDSLKSSQAVKADSIRTGRLKVVYRYRQPIARVRFNKQELTIEPVSKRFIEFGGTFTSVFALSSANNTPALQDNYVQGRSSGGSLQWRGAETGEMFSYGPLLAQLEYDGGTYPYDSNGRLVPRGTGNGIPAQLYDNGILRDGFLQNQALSFRISQGHGYYKKWNLHFKAGTGNESMTMRANTNSSENLSGNFDVLLKKLTVAGGYAAFKTRFSNDNRGGFLNRVYQNSLLTPVTFNNSYGYQVSPEGLLSYGSNNDNPYFLLNDNGHFSKNLQQTGNISLKLVAGKYTMGAGSTLEAIELRSNESLKAGTTFFENGLALQREKDDRRFMVDGYIERRINYTNRKLTSNGKLAYTRNEVHTDIAYRPLNSDDRYEREVNELISTYQTTYDGRKLDAALNIGNKTYQSSTFKKGIYFLPNFDGFLRFKDLFLIKRWQPLKVSATYNKFYTEASPATSYAWYSSTRLSPENAFQFLPTTEASGFAQLRPVKNTEFTSKIELFDNYLFQFTGSFFSRKSKDEVLPVTEGEEIILKNLADVRSSGGELEFTHRTRWTNTFRLSQTLSFSRWTNKVIRVNPGYNYTPIAGFSTVNKSLVEGQPLGVLVGNTYQKDPRGNMLIDSDGFPIANTAASVIGNPIPDFTLKLSQNLHWKVRWDLNLDWEYKKGGDVWNGTRAFLDYYGRSKSSAIERSITNYVFKGVRQDGNINTTPVSFYDPSLPLDRAKWVRYGAGGVASDYIENGDAIRLRNVSVTYTLPIKKLAQRLRFTGYAKNIILWTAYEGVDPDQLMYDQANAQGLDFFNLPSTKSFGVNVSLQF